MNDIMRRIEGMLRVRGMTGAQLSERLGISDTTYYAWKRGNGSPKVEQLKTIVRILGMSPEYYLYGTMGEEAVTATRKKLLLLAEELEGYTQKEQEAILKAMQGITNMYQVAKEKAKG